MTKSAARAKTDAFLPPWNRFEGKVAVVTGASDRGIGGAIAERLAHEKAAVALWSRTEPKRLLKKLGKTGAEARWTRCDITVDDDIRAALDGATEHFGKIDVLINNAGVEVAKPFDEFSDEQWRQIIEVNLSGAIQVARLALPQLIESRGVMVNVASALALGGCSGFSIYSASKAGLMGLTQSLGWELAPRGVRVVGVAPGLVHTPMIHKHTGHLSLELLQQIDECHPQGMGLPRDVASAVAFLASDEARWITGVTLPLGWAPHFSLPVEQFMT